MVAKVAKTWSSETVKRYYKTAETVIVPKFKFKPILGFFIVVNASTV